MVLQEAGKRWTKEIGDSLYAEVSEMAHAVLRHFPDEFEGAVRRSSVGGAAPTRALAQARTAVERFLEDVRRDIDIKVGFSAISASAQSRGNAAPAGALGVFCSYAHEDKKDVKKVKDHLHFLMANAKFWYDRDITAGKDIDQEVREHLESAHIFLFLVSVSFIKSDYCQRVEVKRAMERHEADTARVVPLILRACKWDGAPFAKLKAVPEDGKPVYSKPWRNADEALTNVAEAMEQVVRELLAEQGKPAAGAASPATAGDYRVEVSFEEVRSRDFPENRHWPRPLAYPAVVVDNVGEKSISVRKVLLTCAAVGPDGIARRCAFKLATDGDQSLQPRKPINQDEEREWRRHYYFIQADPQRMKASARRVAEADLDTLQLEVWIEEDQEKPVYTAQGSELYGLHAFILGFWKDIDPLVPI